MGEGRGWDGWATPSDRSTPSSQSINVSSWSTGPQIRLRAKYKQLQKISTSKRSIWPPSETSRFWVIDNMFFLDQTTEMDIYIKRFNYIFMLKWHEHYVIFNIVPTSKISRSDNLSLWDNQGSHLGLVFKRLTIGTNRCFPLFLTILRNAYTHYRFQWRILTGTTELDPKVHRRRYF